MRFAAVGVFAVAAACTPAPPAREACVVERGVEQALDPAPVRLDSHVDYVLDVDAGGPLVCTPGTGTCAACAGNVVTLAQGAQTTLAVIVRNTAPVPFNLVEVALQADADPAFTVLAPVPTSVDARSEAEVFVGVTPTSTAVAEATLLISADADNQSDAFAVTLRVAGTP